MKVSAATVLTLVVVLGGCASQDGAKGAAATPSGCQDVMRLFAVEGVEGV